MFHLSLKQKKFLAAYLPPGGNFNATEAAHIAGYAWPNKAGPRVSHSPKIRPLVKNYFYEEFGRYWDDGQYVYEPPDLSRFGG